MCIVHSAQLQSLAGNPQPPPPPPPYPRIGTLYEGAIGQQQGGYYFIHDEQR